MSDLPDKYKVFLSLVADLGDALGIDKQVSVDKFEAFLDLVIDLGDALGVDVDVPGQLAPRVAVIEARERRNRVERRQKR